MGGQLNDSIAPKAIMAAVYSDPQYNDFIINCNGKFEFRVHRNIVSLESPVLGKMIDTTFKERTAEQTVIQINLNGSDDIVEGLSFMIEYMYHEDFSIDQTAPDQAEPCQPMVPLTVLAQVYQIAHSYDSASIEALAKRKLKELVNTKCPRDCGCTVEVLFANIASLFIQATSGDVELKYLVSKAILRHQGELEGLARYAAYFKESKRFRDALRYAQTRAMLEEQLHRKNEAIAQHSEAMRRASS